MNRFVLPAGLATIEISNRCNARCRWCTTGRENLKNQAAPSTHTAAGMTAQLFEDGVKRLIELGWISKEVTIISLYNWGEPFLNSDLGSILHIVKKYGFRFRLSTNGSIYREIPLDVLENMEVLMISLPGMTQESYDKIHQLNAKQIQENIVKFSKYLAKAGFYNKLCLNFHVYQFNLDEIEDARKFAAALGADLSPHIAYLNDYPLFDQFVTGTMSYKDLYDASQQLFLSHCQASKEEQNECLLWHDIVFDTQFNLLPCCWLNSEEKLGNLFSDPPEKLLRARREFRLCAQCMSHGQSSFLRKPQIPGWFVKMIQGHETEMKGQIARTKELAAINKEQEAVIGELRTHLETIANEPNIGLKGALKIYFEKHLKI